MISREELIRVLETVTEANGDAENVELDSIQQIEVRARLQQFYPSVGERLSEVGAFTNLEELAAEMSEKGILG